MDDALVAGIGFSLADLKAMPVQPGSGATRTTTNTSPPGLPPLPGSSSSTRSRWLAKGLNPLPDYVPTEDGPTPTYPLYIVNWKEALHTHSRTMNNRWLMEFHGENEFWININKARSWESGTATR